MLSSRRLLLVPLGNRLGQRLTGLAAGLRVEARASRRPVTRIRRVKDFGGCSGVVEFGLPLRSHSGEPFDFYLNQLLRVWAAQRGRE